MCLGRIEKSDCHNEMARWPYLKGKLAVSVTSGASKEMGCFNFREEGGRDVRLSEICRDQ